MKVNSSSLRAKLTFEHGRLSSPADKALIQISSSSWLSSALCSVFPRYNIPGKLG